MSMKTYNLRLNTILPSGRASELVHVIASLNGLPQMASRLVCGCVELRNSLNCRREISRDQTTRLFSVFVKRYLEITPPTYKGNINNE